MANGFEIHVDETEFKKKPVSDQNWILFGGIESIKKSVKEINMNGCEYSRLKQRWFALKLASAISAGAVGALGVIYILYQMTCK